MWLPVGKLGPLSPLLNYARRQKFELFKATVVLPTLSAEQYFPRSLHRFLCSWINVKQLTTSHVILPAVENIMNHTTPSPSPPLANTSSAQGTPRNVSAGTKRKRSSGSKFYAVKVGFQPGVYYNWNDCLAQVTGYKGAVCESVTNEYPMVLHGICSSIGFHLPKITAADQ